MSGFKQYLPFTHEVPTTMGGKVVRGIVVLFIFVVIGLLAASVMKAVTGDNPYGERPLHSVKASDLRLVNSTGGGAPNWHVRHFNRGVLGKRGFGKDHTFSALFTNPVQAQQIIRARIVTFKRHHPRLAPESADYYVNRLKDATSCVGGRHYPYYRIAYDVCDGKAYLRGDGKVSKAQVQKAGAITICGGGVIIALAAIPETAGASTFWTTFLSGGTGCAWSAWEAMDPAS